MGVRRHTHTHGRLSRSQARKKVVENSLKDKLFTVFHRNFPRSRSLTLHSRASRTRITSDTGGAHFWSCRGAGNCTISENRGEKFDGLALARTIHFNLSFNHRRRAVRVWTVVCVTAFHWSTVEPKMHLDFRRVWGRSWDDGQFYNRDV